MMKRIYIYLFGAVLLAFVSSCSSTKNMRKSVSIGNLSETEYMTEVFNRAPAWDALTAKMSMAVDLNGKGATKISGTIRMKRDEVIQLSLTAPFIGIEVARAEISPDGILVMDRLNKRYVQVSFAELKGLAKADLDFHSLQALFLNEIFLPGKTTLSARDISAFTVHPENEHAVLEVKNGKKFAYRFRTTADEGLLKESHIGLAGILTDCVGSMISSVRWRKNSSRVTCLFPLKEARSPSRPLLTFPVCLPAVIGKPIPMCPRNMIKLNCKICSNSSLRNETYLPTVYRLLFSECTVGTEHPED